MAKEKCRVVHFEIGKRLRTKEKAINRDLKKLDISVNDLRIFKAKLNGKRDYVFSFSHNDIGKCLKIRDVIRKHFDVKYGGAQ